MKYLGLHKILWAILVLIVLIVEIFILSSYYVLYVMWNFEVPRNFWLEFHSYRRYSDCKKIADRNPWETFIRRYNCFDDWDLISEE